MSQDNKTNDSDTNFKPSMRIMSKILQSLLEKGPVGRTSLSQLTHTNYRTISSHIEWLKEKSLIEITLNNGKTHVRLSPAGRELALRICNFDHL